jgi:HNH endonuclease
MRYVPPPPIAALPSIAQIEAMCTPAIRAAVGAILPQIVTAYTAYEGARPEGLHQLVPVGLTVAQKNALHEVFKRRQGRFREAWTGLNDHFEQTGESTCPYCNFVEQWEHDHYLPRSEFPEFTLYPNNLIPICKHCNGRKLAYFQQNGVRMFQHLFTELNGIVGFLRVDVSYDPTLAVEYSLVRAAALTPQQFAVLELHFEKLELADRYARQASTVLAKLVRQFRTPTNLALGRNALRRRLRQMATDRETATPPNHWEAVLMRALAANSDFTDHVFD